LLSVLYPFVVRRILIDPSPKIAKTLEQFVLKDGKLQWKKLRRLFNEAAVVGVSKVRLLSDVLRSRLVFSLVVNEIFRVLNHRSQFSVLKYLFSRRK